MKCEAIKLLSDLGSEITLKCDLDLGHWGMHHDRIHGVWWSVDHVREPRVYTKKIYISEGAPLPAHIGI